MAIIGILVIVGIILVIIDGRLVGKAVILTIGLVIFCVLTVCTGGLFLFFGSTYMRALMSLMAS